MDYQKALLEVYQGQYPNGICGKMEDCSKGMPNAGHRCSIAKIGCNYGKTGKPKVLFVGKEGISDSGGSMATTISEPAAMEDIDRDNWHYIGTIYTAALLLTDVNPERICWDEMRSFSELRHDFCLTNYFKCAFKTKEQEEKHHDVKTNLQMSKNCAKILLEEIRAIQPAIVVVQGKFCHSSFWNKQGLLAFSTGKVVYESKMPGVSISVSKFTRIADQSVFYVIWSYHPCARGRRWFRTLPEFYKAIEYVKNDTRRKNMFEAASANVLIDEWRNLVEMKNPYQFGVEEIDMEQFQSVLKHTYVAICELKGGFIRGQCNAEAIFRFAELISVMAQYIPDTCTNDESEEHLFTVTCLLAKTLIGFATNGDDLVLDGEAIKADGQNCPHKICYFSDDIDGCLVYDFDTGDYSDFTDYAKFIC